MLCFRNCCAIEMGRGTPPKTPQIASDQSALLFGLHMCKINDYILRYYLVCLHLGMV